MADHKIKDTEIAATGAEDRVNQERSTYDSMTAAPPPMRRRGAGFAPILAAIILLVGGFTTYTFMQNADQNEANNGQIIEPETGVN